VLLGVTVLYFFVRVIFLAHLIYTAKESDKVCGPLTNTNAVVGEVVPATSPAAPTTRVRSEMSFTRVR
jgi:hypothetical protein